MVPIWTEIDRPKTRISTTGGGFVHLGLIDRVCGLLVPVVCGAKFIGAALF